MLRPTRALVLAFLATLSAPGAAFARKEIEKNAGPINAAGVSM